MFVLLSRYMQVATLSLLSALCVHGQSRNAPVTAEVSTISVGNEGRSVLSIEVRNVSQFEIIAYVLRIEASDESGKRLFTSDKTYIRGLGGATATPGYAPGASWVNDVEMPEQGTHHYNLTVDYVRTTDPQHPDWGLDRSRKSQFILGAVAVYRTERARLRRLLRDKGPQGVVDDLNTP